MAKAKAKPIDKHKAKRLWAQGRAAQLEDGCGLLPPELHHKDAEAEIWLKGFWNKPLDQYGT